MVELKRIGPLSVAKVGALFGIIVGLLLGIFMKFYVGIIAPSLTGVEVGYSWSLFILLPVLYGVLYFIGGLISAAIYNLIAGWTGGIRLDLSKK